MKNKLQMEEVIQNFLDDELKEAALELSAYLTEKQLKIEKSGKTDWKIPYEKCYLCEIRFEPENWEIVFFSGDYSGDFDEGFIKTVQDSVKYCTKCHDCTSATDTAIFGRKYKNVCGELTIRVKNPSGIKLEHVKQLIEFSKKIAPGSVSYHARNL